jgi:hypothetical protein
LATARFTASFKLSLRVNSASCARIAPALAKLQIANPVA